MRQEEIGSQTYTLIFRGKNRLFWASPSKYSYFYNAKLTKGKITGIKMIIAGAKILNEISNLLSNLCGWSM